MSSCVVHAVQLYTCITCIMRSVIRVFEQWRTEKNIMGGISYPYPPPPKYVPGACTHDFHKNVYPRRLAVTEMSLGHHVRTRSSPDNNTMTIGSYYILYRYDGENDVRTRLRGIVEIYTRARVTRPDPTEPSVFRTRTRHVRVAT